MYSLETVLSFLLVLNLFSCALILTALLRLPAGGSKYSLLLLIMVNLLWQNAVILIHTEKISPNVVPSLSRLVITCGMLLASSLLLFAWHFTGGGRRYSRPFLILQSAALFFIILALLGFVERGVRAVDYGYQPIYGPLYIPYVLTVFLLAGYGIYLIIQRYRQEKNQLLRFQYLRLLWISLFAVLASFITNALLPIVFQSSYYSFLGGFFPLLILSEILRLLIGRERLFLKKQFHKVISDKVWQAPENISSLMRLLDFLKHFMQKSPARFSEKFSFQGRSGKKRSLYLEHISHLAFPKSEKNETLSALPALTLEEKFIEGMAHNMIQLDSNNKRLTLALVAAQQKLKLKTLEQQLKSASKSKTTLPLHHPGAIASLPISVQGKPLRPLEVSEKEIIELYLEMHNFNKFQTSRALGININTLKAKIIKYGLKPKAGWENVEQKFLGEGDSAKLAKRQKTTKKAEQKEEQERQERTEDKRDEPT